MYIKSQFEVVDPLITIHMFGIKSPFELDVPTYNWIKFTDQNPNEGQLIYTQEHKGVKLEKYGDPNPSGFGDFTIRLGAWCDKKTHDQKCIEYMRNNPRYPNWIWIENNEKLIRFIYEGPNRMNGTTIVLHNSGLVEFNKSDVFNMVFDKGVNCSIFETIMNVDVW